MIIKFALRNALHEDYLELKELENGELKCKKLAADLDRLLWEENIDQQKIAIYEKVLDGKFSKIKVLKSKLFRFKFSSISISSATASSLASLSRHLARGSSLRLAQRSS